ncbi:hypothetical protein V1523DRAFT_421772 [Lipomyces doorenjongii]
MRVTRVSRSQRCPDRHEIYFPSTSFPNTALGASQELSRVTHLHLELERAMVQVPRVQQGD